ncbi:uncharacterized mitochondrial protein AtMg00810-like [Amaranthus tricolor]|uniref:uncharacterized mitochondrial protein AtMg00810-like n=1 Tax=Amaranthus tricolor TaxID=29722 RepID=UPI00258635B7|nr:uncharacterized mitochondrial protein AtMg00810-like [Amaranthus tricolor]
MVLLSAIKRVLLVMSWSIHQLDVKNAFLHGHLAETAPRAWYHRFATFATTIDFSNSISDNSLFVYCHGSDIAYLLLYVDDIILTASSDLLRESHMSKLTSEFAMKDLGPLNYFLGIAVNHTSTGLYLSQQRYASEILEKAGMSQCKPVATSGKLCVNAGSSCDDPTLYHRLACALQYLTFTRPDISYVVQQVCLYMHDPRIEHMAAIHRILRYVKGSILYGLQLYRSNLLTFLSYTDTDWWSAVVTTKRLWPVLPQWFP